MTPLYTREHSHKRLLSETIGIVVINTRLPGAVEETFNLNYIR